MHRIATKVRTYSPLLRYPLLPPLRREVIGCELRKHGGTLHELRGMAELEHSNWLGLGTLAYRLVRRYRPKVIVELGTHMGFSALAMSLALRDMNEGGKFYAIDTWKGDEHTSAYGENVYQTFLKRREQLRLNDVIVPLRMTFDEALTQVPSTIDLLHIDGLHTMEAVTHDFATYGPRVKAGGIVLFHDVRTHFTEMRVFWKDLSNRYENHLVPYSHGLGVIRIPQVPAS
jgi:predicted O-methyltransferase YrrM